MNFIKSMWEHHRPSFLLFLWSVAYLIYTIATSMDKPHWIVFAATVLFFNIHNITFAITHRLIRDRNKYNIQQRSKISEVTNDNFDIVQTRLNILLERVQEREQIDNHIFTILENVLTVLENEGYIKRKSSQNEDEWKVN